MLPQRSKTDPNTGAKHRHRQTIGASPSDFVPTPPQRLLDAATAAYGGADASETYTGLRPGLAKESE